MKYSLQQTQTTYSVTHSRGVSSNKEIGKTYSKNIEEAIEKLNPFVPDGVKLDKRGYAKKNNITYSVGEYHVCF